MREAYVAPVTVATNLSNEVDGGDTPASKARTGKHLTEANCVGRVGLCVCTELKRISWLISHSALATKFDYLAT